MIKQSRTTIKELTAQYRAVLKRAFLAGIAAVAVVSTANAEPTPLSAPLSLATEIIPDSAPAYSDGSYTPKVWNAESHTLTNGDSTTTTVTDPGSAPASTSVTFSERLTTGETTLGGYSTGYSISDPTGTPTSLTIDATNAAYNYTKTRADGSTTSVGLTAGDISDSPVLAVTGYDYAVTTAYRKDDASSVNIGAANSRDVPAYADYQFKDGDDTYYLEDFITESGDLALSKTLHDGTTKLMDKPDLMAEAAAALNAYGTDTTAYNNVLHNYEISNDAYGEAVGLVNDDQDIVDAAIEAYRQSVGSWKAASESFSAYGDAQTAKNTYEKSLAYAIDNRAEAVVSDAIDDVRAEATEAYTHAHNWAEYVTGLDVDEDRETQLQTALEGLEAIDEIDNTIGSDNIAGALHELDGDIQGVRAEATEAYTHAHNWAEYVTGLDVDEDRETQLQTALNNLAGEDYNNTIESTNFAGALHELDVDIQDIDSKKLGTINGLKEYFQTMGWTVPTNLANGTDSTVSDHLIALDSAIGDLSALEGGEYVSNQSVALNLSALDDAVAANTGAINLLNGGADVAGSVAYGDALTLNSANAYTDKQVESLEKNMSAGIASAAALSSVEVSNVKKGEVSVGGGYGYHNNQSAVAFGAAMGLSDNWSMNAGVGMGFNDSSNVTVRAGTNYKFKLF